MWSADRIAPAQEHFICNLIRQKLNSSIDMLPVNSNAKKHWLLFLPENEFHETGLLMANYLVRHAGHRSTYFGANVPLDSLQSAVKQLKPTFLLFFLVLKDDVEQDKKLIHLMCKTFRRQKVFVAAGADRLANIKATKNLNKLSSPIELKKVLN
jgi:methanogenic corrinoid protein MtbC1